MIVLHKNVGAEVGRRKRERELPHRQRFEFIVCILKLLHWDTNFACFCKSL